MSPLNRGIRLHELETVEGRPIASKCLDLVVKGFFLDAVGARVEEGRVQSFEATENQVGAFASGRLGPVLPVPLQSLLTQSKLLSVLLELTGEPVGGFFRDHRLELAVLDDVSLGQAVGHCRGQLRIRGPERHVDQPAPAHLLDFEPLEEGIDRRALLVLLLEAKP